MPSPIRLNKVLKELNISLDRAVEFLSSKKIDIEARPTSKIDQDVYDLLLDEFQTDKSDKDKLEEINNKFNLIKNNTLVIDLGAAPGSWSQFISRNFNNSKIISIDLKDIEPIKNLVHIKGDFTDEKHKKKIKLRLLQQ